MKPRVPFGIKALLGANFFSTFAYIGFVTFIGVEVFDITGRELDLGLIGLSLFVPVFLLAPFTGTVNDRFDRRKVYGVSIVAEIALATVLYLYVRTDPDDITPIFVVIVLFGATRAFAGPASRALPIDLAPDDVLERVIALKSLAWQGGIILGPIVAGFVAGAGHEYPFLVAAVALTISLGLLLFVPKARVEQLDTPPGAAQAVHDAVEGAHFIFHRPVLLGAISLDLFAVLLGGAVALLPAIAEKRLGVGDIGLGWLRAAEGIGAATVSLALAFVPLRRHVGRVLFAAVAVFGGATIALGLTTQYAVAFVTLMVLAGADAISVFIRSSLVPLATPDVMRGRVIAVENVFIGGSNELGALESGIVAHFLGLVGAVVTGGIGTLVVVAVWWNLFPRLRDIDTFDDARYEKPAVGSSEPIDVERSGSPG